MHIEMKLDQVAEQEGIQARNVFHWRVPNEDPTGHNLDEVAVDCDEWVQVGRRGKTKAHPSQLIKERKILGKQVGCDSAHAGIQSHGDPQSRAGYSSRRGSGRGRGSSVTIDAGSVPPPSLPVVPTAYTRAPAANINCVQSVPTDSQPDAAAGSWRREGALDQEASLDNADAHERAGDMDGQASLRDPCSWTEEIPQSASTTSQMFNSGASMGVKHKQQLVAYLLRNMRRAVDEVFCMCEVENDARLVQLALSILEESSQDLRALGHRIHAHQLFEVGATGHRATGSKAIAWEVRRADASARRWHMLSSFARDQHLHLEDSAPSLEMSAPVPNPAPTHLPADAPDGQPLHRKAVREIFPSREQEKEHLSHAPGSARHSLHVEVHHDLHVLEEPDLTWLPANADDVGFLLEDEDPSQELGLGAREGACTQLRDHQLGQPVGGSWKEVLRGEGERNLHQKLMSPDRKKKSPMETKRMVEEKQRRAEQKRELMERELQHRLAKAEGERRDVRRKEEERQLRRARDAENKQWRSQELRQLHIQQRARKAGEVHRKVREVLFINEVDAQNRKLSLEHRMGQTASRRQEHLDSIRNRHKEESLALAAEERRRQLLEERQAKLEESARRKELAEQKREEERRAAAEALEARNQLKGATCAQRARAYEELSKARGWALSNRLSAAAARRLLYLEDIRERAIGSADHKDSSSPHSPPGPSASGVAQSQAQPSSSPSRPSLLSSPGRRAMAMATHHHTGLAYVADSQGGPEEEAANKASLQARRRRSKKLRQKLAALSHCHAEEAAGATVVGGASDAVSRLSKLKSEMDKCYSRANYAGLESTLHEMLQMIADAPDRSASASGHSQAKAVEGARRAGVLRLAVEIVASSVNTHAQASPSRCKILTLRLLQRLLMASPSNCEYVVCENLLPPLVPHLLVLLEASDESAAGASAVNGGAGGGSAVNPAILGAATRPGRAAVQEERSQAAQAVGILEVCVVLLRCQLVCERALAMRHHLVSYVVASGLVHRLRDLFSLFDRPNQGGQRDPLPPVVEWSIRLLQTLAEDPSHYSSVPATAHVEYPPTGTYIGGGAPPAGAVGLGESAPSGQSTYTLSSAMRETALAGLPSLLTTILLSAERVNRAPVLSCVDTAADILPVNFVSIATEALRGINAFACFDLPAAQLVMGAPDLKVEMYHLISFLISFCTFHWDSNAGVRDLLQEVLLLTGHFCLLQPAHQDVMRWGQNATILQKLCSVPFAFFCDPALMPVLFPTIIAAAFSNDRNKEVIQWELSLEMIETFIQDCVKVGPASQCEAGARFSLHARFPCTLWGDAEEFFSTISDFTDVGDQQPSQERTL